MLTRRQLSDIGQRIADAPAPPPTPEQWTATAPPTQPPPPPQVTLYPSVPQVPAAPRIVDRVAYLQAQQQAATEFQRLPGPLGETRSRYGQGLQAPSGYTSDNVIDRTNVDDRAFNVGRPVQGEFGASAIQFEDASMLRPVPPPTQPPPELTEFERLAGPLGVESAKYADRNSYERLKRMFDGVRRVVGEQTARGLLAKHLELTKPLGKNEVRSPERVAYERQKYVQSRPNQGVSITDSPIYKGLRADIPYADELADAVNMLPQFKIPREIQERVLPAWATKYTPEFGDLTVPQEVWELAVEFVPGIGEVPEMVRAVRKGSPEAVTALRRAFNESPAGQNILRGLASEEGLYNPFGKSEQRAAIEAKFADGLAALRAEAEANGVEAGMRADRLKTKKQKALLSELNQYRMTRQLSLERLGLEAEEARQFARDNHIGIAMDRQRNPSTAVLKKGLSEGERGSLKLPGAGADDELPVQSLTPEEWYQPPEYPAVYYHGTTKAAADQIRADGFRAIAYGTPNRDEALAYAMGKAREAGDTPVVIAFSADPRRVTVGTNAGGDQYGVRMGFRPQDVRIDEIVDAADDVATIRAELDPGAGDDSAEFRRLQDELKKVEKPFVHTNTIESDAALRDYDFQIRQATEQKKPRVLARLQKEREELVAYLQKRRDDEAAIRARISQVAGGKQFDVTVTSSAGMGGSEKIRVTAPTAEDAMWTLRKSPRRPIRAEEVVEAAPPQLYTKGPQGDVPVQPGAGADDISTSAASSALPAPATLPDNVIAALKNRNAAIAKDPEAFARAWELLPAENQKMISAMADAVLTPTQRKAITRAGKARQTARAREAIEKTAGSTLERAQAARGAMGGRYIPQIDPIGGAFDADEITSLFGQIDEAFNTRKLIPQEHANATDAMELLMYGKRPLSPDKPLSLMPHEIKLLGRIYGPEFEAMLPKSKRELTLFQKAIDIANLPRAIISGVDVSAPGRQGIMLAARNPVEWAKAWGPMVKSMASEKQYSKALTHLQTDEYFEDATLHGVDFTNIGTGLGDEGVEETFATRLLQTNPILKQTVGRGERGYVMYLNRLRMDVYKKGAQRLERTAQKHNWTPERLDLAKKDWGGFVNHASGRGDLGSLNEYVPAFNALFFSPRFVISRPQTIYDLVKSDPAVRQMVGENLGAFVGGGMLLLTAAAASGLAQVELDPRSTDFGKMRIGNQRIEFWGGWQPIARYIAQAASGERKTLDSGELVDVNRGKTVGRFIRSKLSPAGALGYDILIEGGKNYEGESFLTPKQLPQEALDRLTPLIIQDAIEGYKAQGPLAAARAAGVSAIGGGVGTFETSESEQKKAEKSKSEEEFNKKFPGVQAIPDAALQAVQREFPAWKFEGETYEEAIEQIKADATERGVSYEDTNIYKALNNAVEERNMNARLSDPEIDAYWVAYKGAKPLSEEAQRLAKEITGITVELHQDAK